MGGGKERVSPWFSGLNIATPCVCVSVIAIALLSFKKIDLNECATNLHNCHPDGSCINTDGSFICSCKQGFFGNGIQCLGTYVHHLIAYHSIFIMICSGMNCSQQSIFASHEICTIIIPIYTVYQLTFMRAKNKSNLLLRNTGENFVFTILLTCD